MGCHHQASLPGQTVTQHLGQSLSLTGKPHYTTTLSLQLLFMALPVCCLGLFSISWLLFFLSTNEWVYFNCQLDANAPQWPFWHTHTKNPLLIFTLSQIVTQNFGISQQVHFPMAPNLQSHVQFLLNTITCQHVITKIQSYELFKTFSEGLCYLRMTYPPKIPFHDIATQNTFL